MKNIKTYRQDPQQAIASMIDAAFETIERAVGARADASALVEDFVAVDGHGQFQDFCEAHPVTDTFTPSDWAAMNRCRTCAIYLSARATNI